MPEVQAEGEVIECGDVTDWGQLEFVQELARLLGGGVLIWLCCLGAMPADGAEEPCNKHGNPLISRNLSSKARRCLCPGAGESS